MPKLVRSGFLKIAVACLAVTVLIALAVPTLLRRRIAAGCEITAPKDLCDIDRAVKAYMVEHGTTPPALSSLHGRIVPALSCDAPACEYRFYRFRYTASQGSSKPRYSISAQALSGTGSSFYLDESGLLRHTHENREATNSDPSAAEVALPCKQ